MTDWLKTLGREFVGVQTPGDVYQTTVNVTQRLLDAEVCTLARTNDGVLVPNASTATAREGPDLELPISARFLGTVVTSGEPRVIEDLLDVRSTAAQSHAQSTRTVRSMVAVPFGAQGVVIAAAIQPGAFTDADRDRAEEISAYATAALERIQSSRAGSSDGDRLEEVGSILAHDLKSPLTVAQGRLELAQVTGDERHLDHVGNAIRRIDAITDDLAMLARTNDRIGSLEPVDLEDLSTTAWKTAGMPTATLETEETQPIVADASTVCQLLENLFQNAINHGGDTVTVRIGGTESGFYVADDGPGIPPGERERVFEWRLSSDADHTGLGLSIVQRIANAHDWDVTITESEFGGTRIEITGVEFPDATN